MGKGVTAALMQIAQVEPGMDVLDLASGEGDPVLTLAALVGEHGTVTATDVNPGPLAAAAVHARQSGISNIQFHVADAQQLPFEDAAFDRVTCRFGVMFFPDPLAARSCSTGGVGIYRTTLFPGIPCTSATVRWWPRSKFGGSEPVQIRGTWKSFGLPA